MHRIFEVALKWLGRIGRMRARIAHTLLVAACVPMLAGCASSRESSIPYGSQYLQPSPDVTAAQLDPAYRIASLDKLSIQVFRVDNLSGTFEVDPAGQVTLPLIGAVPAAGLTTQQLSAEIESRYAASYLRNPKVLVSVAEARGSTLTVDGAVRQPGLYPVTGKTTLLQAVAMARGLDDSANRREILVFRTVEGQKMAAAFDLAEIRSGNMDDPSLYQGDIVVVGSSKNKRFLKDLGLALPIAGIFVPLLIFGLVQ